MRITFDHNTSREERQFSALCQQATRLQSSFSKLCTLCPALDSGEWKNQELWYQENTIPYQENTYGIKKILQRHHLSDEQPQPDCQIQPWLPDSALTASACGTDLLRETGENNHLAAAQLKKVINWRKWVKEQEEKKKKLSWWTLASPSSIFISACTVRSRREWQWITAV